MNSIKSFPKPSATASSRPETEAKEELSQQSLFGADRLEFDLVAQLSHMSSLSTAGYGRDRLFDVTSRLSYSTSGFFRSVRLLATRLNYDYPTACEVVAERTKNGAMRSFLLRTAGSLAAGEKESDFLQRETEVQFEGHKNKYERDLEGLRKWTDGFVALEVSVTLIVIISIVSMMIYPMPPVMVLGLCAVGISVSALGAYLIFRSAPAELIVHNLRIRSPLQHKTIRVGRILIPVSLVAGVAVMALTRHLEWALVAAGVLMFPAGFLANRYHGEIDRRDQEAAAFLRAVGGVSAAIGTTTTEALSRIDFRSLGYLQHDVGRLHSRLKQGITPQLCWDRFVAETGSELIRRSVAIFWDGIAAGGDAGRIGFLSSRFAMHIQLLRAKRALVSATFGWLMLPMHLTLVALLSFIVEIFAMFSGEILKAQQVGLSAADGLGPEALSGLPTSEALGFGALDMGFVRLMVTVVLVSLTFINGFVTNAAAGGDRYRLCYTVSMMTIIAGVTLVIVPVMVDLIFGSIL